MKDRTIIYYTSNRENPAFEKRVTDCLRSQSGRIRIISVSQKPIEFGDNICVGELPFNETSLLKQILIGLKAADTKYCIAAESDFIYPPEYFQFVPDKDDRCYRYTNVWVRWIKKNGWFYKKYYSEGCQICGRQYWIDCIEKALNEGVSAAYVFPVSLRNRWSSDNPAVSFKTGNGLHKKSGLKRSVKPVRTLPYWGECDEFIH